MALPLLAAGSLAFPAGAAHAATLHVMNCNDAGVGSLRQTVASAADSGDTVDLRGLSCHRIVLTSGQIQVKQRSLTIRGPGSDALTVDGSHASRVFWSTGDYLHLMDVSIANGYLRGRLGGCVLARNTLRLDHVDVHDCLVQPLPSDSGEGSSGGGVYANSNLSIYDSRIFRNTIKRGYGGGAGSPATIIIERSRISDNHATHAGGLNAHFADSVELVHSQINGNTADVQAGGMEASGPVLIRKSTIANNTALHDTGAIGLDVDSRTTLAIQESTISGNQAPIKGAIAAIAPNGEHGSIDIENSTIAFNRETTDDPTQCVGAVSTDASTIEVHAHSSIFARSRCHGATGSDISLAGDAPVQGASNLIERSSSPVPGDTIMANPMLAPLARNGGLTKTHVLMAGSPAIDTGSNLSNDKYDQRGYNFPRVKGAGPDIGAVEKQK
jgi:hypothetical protein